MPGGKPHPARIAPCSSAHSREPQLCGGNTNTLRKGDVSMSLLIAEHQRHKTRHHPFESSWQKDLSAYPEPSESRATVAHPVNERDFLGDRLLVSASMVSVVEQR